MRSERYDLGEEPVLSNLSGQEFAALYTHGYWPVGIAAATTVCYAMTSWETANALSSPMFGGERLAKPGGSKSSPPVFTTPVRGSSARSFISATSSPPRGSSASATSSTSTNEADRYGKRKDLIVTVRPRHRDRADSQYRGTTTDLHRPAIERGGSMTDQEQEQYDPQSTAGVPEHGRERLERIKATGGKFFTSDLSVNEFLLVKPAGYDPLGLVVGSSIYHVRPTFAAVDGPDGRRDRRALAGARTFARARDGPHGRRSRRARRRRHRRRSART